MATKTIKVLRKFYHNGILLEAGKIVTVSEVEAKGYVGNNKAVIIPEEPEVVVKKEEPKKEEPKPEAPKSKEPPARQKKEE